MPVNCDFTVHNLLTLPIPIGSWVLYWGSPSIRQHHSSHHIMCEMLVYLNSIIFLRICDVYRCYYQLYADWFLNESEMTAFFVFMEKHTDALANELRANRMTKFYVTRVFNKNWQIYCRQLAGIQRRRFLWGLWCNLGKIHDWEGQRVTIDWKSSAAQMRRSIWFQLDSTNGPIQVQHPAAQFWDYVSSFKTMPEAVTEPHRVIHGMSVMHCFLLCWKLMDVGIWTRKFGWQLHPIWRQRVWGFNCWRDS